MKLGREVQKEGLGNYDWTWKGRFDHLGTSVLRVASENTSDGLVCTLSGPKAILKQPSSVTRKQSALTTNKITR